MSTIKKIKHNFMARSRERKYYDFIELTSLAQADTILDVGVADREFSPYDNYLEKKYPHQSQITALSVKAVSEFKQRYPEVRTVTYQGGRFPFSDKEFSVVHSNAVIEHVGDKQAQIVFIKEMARCGRQFFFSTPAREFLLEIHTNYPFIHWLPKPIFDFLIIRLGKGWASGSYMYLLTGRGLKNLLQESGIENYKIITYRMWGIPYQHVVFAGT